MSKKLNILFIAGWYPSRVTPDSGDFIQRHARAISTIHNLKVIHVKSDKNATKKFEIVEKDEGAYTSRIAYIKPSRFILFKAIQFIQAFKELLKDEETFDLVHVNKLFPFGLVGLYLKIFRKKAYLITEHFHGYFRPYSNKISFFQRILSKLITKQASYICPVSKSLGHAMQDFGLKGNYRPIPNLIDTDLFKPVEKSNSTFNILHISSMSPIKNVPLILKTIAKFQEVVGDFHLFLIGTNANKYNVLLKELKIPKLKTTIFEQLPHEELIDFYQQADVFVLFSDMETFSIVTYESIACGTPVIATDVGGIKDYFPKEYGYLIGKRDEKALLKSLLDIYAQKNIRNVQMMHQYVESHFSQKIIANSYSELYNKMLNIDH